MACSSTWQPGPDQELSIARRIRNPQSRGTPEQRFRHALRRIHQAISPVPLDAHDLKTGLFEIPANVPLACKYQVIGYAKLVGEFAAILGVREIPGFHEDLAARQEHGSNIREDGDSLP
jgi:hypothetical protein